MKKLFLNPHFLHVFYGSVVALLCGYIYLSDVKSEEYESVAAIMCSQAEETSRFSHFTKNEFLKYANAYRNEASRNAEERVNRITSINEFANNELNKIVQDFQNNLEKQSYFLKKTSIPTRQFFNEEKIFFLQKTIKTAIDSIAANINDPKDREALLQKYTFYDFSKEGFRTLPADFAIAKLNQQIAALESWKLVVMNYYSRRHTSCDIKFDRFLIALSPHSSTAKVGEPYSIDLALTDYSSHASEPYITYYIDGEVINSKYGLATFTKKYNTAGKKTIQARTVVKNPLTSQVDVIMKEFSFEVMEK